MELKWTSKALSDLSRLYEFLAVTNKAAAAKTIQALTAAPSRFLTNSRIGERLDGYDTREVRRILIGQYEMRYEISNAVIYILRIWHAREDR